MCYTFAIPQKSHRNPALTRVFCGVRVFPFGLFNPRTQNWWPHFSWSEDGLRVIGLTPIGRATVVALHLSTDSDALIVRSFWVEAGWHPPTKPPLTSQDD